MLTTSAVHDLGLLALIQSHLPQRTCKQTLGDAPDVWLHELRKPPQYKG